MGGTTYYAVTAEQQLAEAQRVVIFSRTLRLPRRGTGAAIAAHIGADFAVLWFGRR